MLPCPASGTAIIDSQHLAGNSIPRGLSILNDMSASQDSLTKRTSCRDGEEEADTLTTSGSSTSSRRLNTEEFDSELKSSLKHGNALTQYFVAIP